MNFQDTIYKSVFKTTPTTKKLVNPNVNQYRLNNEQRVFYTELFNENASNGKVKRENFLPLLGIFGTKIAQDFSDRMFLVLSKGQPEITLEEYLTYIDTYHYGDVHERCLYTCKLMDTKGKGKIDLDDFKSYINLIINTVEKVNNTLTKKDLMNDKDIEYLFYHISQGKNFFTYNDFENIYQEKPELVSWFDYFKNDKEDILLIINEFIPKILKLFNDFVWNFISDLFLLLDKEKEINLDLIFQKVLNYSNKLEKLLNIFIKKVSKFSLTNAFNNIKNHNKDKINLIFGLKNKIFESNINAKNIKNNYNMQNNNIDDVFKEIKKSIYQKEEVKEYILENNNIKYPKNENNHFKEKFLRRSSIFGNKSFKFFDNRDSNNALIKSNDLTQNKLNNINNINKNLQNNINSSNNINNYNDKCNINNNLILNESVDKNYMNNINANNTFNNNSNVYFIDNYMIPKENFHPYYLIGNTYNYNVNSMRGGSNYDRYEYEMQNYINSKIQSSLIPETDFNLLKNSQKIKQLLFCSRVIIERALETNLIVNNCFRWISDNYLSKYVSKKLKENKLKEKKKFKIKNSTLNIARKMVPIKKKIIGASEKSFEILFNMIMGIQIAVQAIPNFRINNREEIGKYLTKMVYSIQTVYLGKEKEETYLLKEFGGVIFNNIRLYLGINKDEFIKSISPQDFITELMISSQTIFEELCSTGSSGSLLYYTRDGEFIVKTISRKEYKFLKTIIGEYFFYLKDNPVTFLPKLLGCYVLKRKLKKKVTNIYFIVMNNVFATDHHIDLRFDLKGSTIGRKVLTGTINDSKIFMNGDMALKDQDFNKLNERVNIGTKREIILNQLKKDIDFLYSINSNDYSLLLGIHYIKENERYSLSKTNTLKTVENKKDELSFLTKNTIFTTTYDTESNISSEKSLVDRINNLKTIYDFEDGGIFSENKKRIYYFGIIDILTEFNNIKNLEYLYKKVRYCSENMSCIPPIFYKARFFNYLNNVVFPQQERKSLEIKSDNNLIIKSSYNVDRYGNISSSSYKQYQNNENNYTLKEDNSLQKL